MKKSKRKYLKIILVVLIVLLCIDLCLFLQNYLNYQDKANKTEMNMFYGETDEGINVALQNSNELKTGKNGNDYYENIDDSEESVKDNKQQIVSENKKENSNEIFGNYYDKADELLKTMTLEEKVGQMFLARYPGSASALNEIKTQHPGGYVLFAKDFSGKNKNTMASELSNNQSNSNIPMFLAVDEEGGTVVRVSNYTAFRNSKFKSPQELYKTGGLQAMLEDSTEKSNLLKSIGLNMNLAPVVDIPTNTASFIYARSFGKNAQETAELTESLIKRMNEDNMISSMKHFPGYGDNVDTHTGIAIDTRDYVSFQKNDFIPFESGINANAPTIMVNHNIVNSMDKTKPASLSENVHRILREELDFSGLIITDDLAMQAVRKYVTNGEAAVQAVIAGNDMIISSDFRTQKQQVINAVKNGRISEDTIDTAVRRILACKYAYGLIK